eukprot:CAMPEP_0202468164 /NCGR_PEP_ID=MMETSP1360-20130828/74429_1 /ASSEMBLY_ACC=CAM_ASM_000848 /TAXON_ID=515479 /ORGANISM="Licmophora paradoxa, Strain CCMP2313" /LENGTH=145 /DNA_ID=CAMNT_0049092995 /DNA_START=22 /DNA_END=459 /DNA_ORIENTATION=-
MNTLDTLDNLRGCWNRLDQDDFGSFCSYNKRKLYLSDMKAIRRGQQAYYSLGGDDRRAFSETFLGMSRRMQEIFITSAANCLQEGRYIQRSDIERIIHESRGKRKDEIFHHVDSAYNRTAKRNRTSYWVQGAGQFDQATFSPPSF